MYDLSIGFKREFLLSVYPLAYLTVDHFPWEIIDFLYLPGIYLYIYIIHIYIVVYIYNYVYIYMGLFEHGV